MGLQTYWRKRRFDKTPEPRGKAARSAQVSSFTIQRHHASRLHYDFRLELDGVLKSWAVPKGPSLDSKDRRLAVEVEDHPLEYGTFEGEIPQGQYGGGKVVLWDRGTWRPVDDAREGLRKGHLRFILDGVKLRGRWDLIRLRGREAERGKTNWLLIKVADEHALPRERYDVTEARPESVASAAARRARKVWRSNRAPAKSRRPTARPRPVRLAPERVAAAKKAPMPGKVDVELCTLVDAAPEGAEWLHEVKLDGYRIVAFVDGDDVRLSTRKGHDWTRSFPPVGSALLELPCRRAILDGEVVVLDQRGVSSFQALQNVLSQSGRGQLVYYVFDLLYLDGYDLRGAPLRERKALLQKLLARAPATVRYCDHVEGRGPAFLEQACAHELEGIVCKRADAVYVGRRTKQWLKAKCLRRQEFVIAGYTEPSGSRSGFGALALAARERGELRYAGRVGTGFGEKALRSILARLKALERPDCPLPKPPPAAAARGVHWVEPRLVAEVAFGEWTDEGILRHPRFVGLREDKPAEEVRVERPQPVEEAASPGGARLTNPGRVLYPEQGVTKLDLARYYEAVAPLALPHLGQRPLSLVRCPGGRGKHCFFQKHLPAPQRPDSLKPVEIAENEVTRTYCYLEDVAGLVSLVQLGVLEIHPWGSRVGTLEKPDVMTFDLDPAEDVAWPAMIEAARGLRERLKQLGLRSFLKTTGGKGLHVVVPLKPRSGWDRVKEFSKQLVELMVRDEPGRYTANMAKAKRPGKIFLDYLRNGRGATAVGAYSTRARPNAPVAAPLAWDELDRRLRSDRFTVKNMAARLKSLGADPWAGFFDVDQSLR